MEPDEANRHRVRRQLLSCLGHIRDAVRGMYMAEEHSELCSRYSPLCGAIHSNIDAIRAGIEETVKLISQEAQRIKLEMETPSETPPPIYGAYRAQSKRKTRLQLHLEKEGFLKVDPKPPPIPKTAGTGPAPPKPIPNIITFTYRPRPKQKPRTRKKEGIIPI